MTHIDSAAAPGPTPPGDTPTIAALTIDALTLASARRTIVDALSLTIAPREIVGLVGESGSGKSQTALAIAGLTPPGIVRRGGTIMLGGTPVADDDPARLRAVRGREVAYVFQEPMTALNPTIRLRRQMRDVIRCVRGGDARDADARAAAMLETVGMADPARVLDSYPHQLSGGMRQRVLIALAFACEPRLIVADEPTTALDVLVQAQLLALLAALARDRDCGVLFVSHDLAAIRQVCDRIYVMQAGHIVESGITDAVLGAPQHHYTRMLIASTAEGLAA